MEVRKAKIEDIEQIVELWKELVSFHKNFGEYWAIDRTKNTENVFREWAKKRIEGKDSTILVTADENKIVGFLLGFIKKRPPVLKVKKVAYISDCVVYKEYRKKGITREMVKEFIKWAKKKKVKWVELQTSSKNEIGIKAWKKIGFEKYAEDMIIKI